MAREYRISEDGAPGKELPERRRSMRYQPNLLIRELRPNQASRRVISMNSYGMYIRTSVPYPKGTLVVCEISTDSKPTVVLAARVVRCDANRGIALEFMSPEVEAGTSL